MGAGRALNDSMAVDSVPGAASHERGAGKLVRDRGAVRRRQDHAHPRAPRARARHPSFGVLYDAAASRRRAGRRRLPFCFPRPLRDAQGRRRISRARPRARQLVRHVGDRNGSRRRSALARMCCSRSTGRVRRRSAPLFRNRCTSSSFRRRSPRSSKGWCAGARTMRIPSRSGWRLRARKSGIARSSIMLLLIRSLPRLSTIWQPWSEQRDFAVLNKPTSIAS